MKKLNPKVVIATTAGLATMVLAAACGYGPPEGPVEPAINNESTTDSTVTDNKENDASSIVNSIDEELNNSKGDDAEIEAPTLYGPPPGN